MVAAVCPAGAAFFAFESGPASFESTNGSVPPALRVMVGTPAGAWFVATRLLLRRTGNYGLHEEGGGEQQAEKARPEKRVERQHGASSSGEAWDTGSGSAAMGSGHRTLRFAERARGGESPVAPPPGALDDGPADG